MILTSAILTLDRTLTLAINNCHTPLFDQFFFLFSRTQVWIPLFLVLVFIMWRSYGWRTALSLVIAVCLSVLLSDQMCNIIKLTVCRFRPSHEPSLSGMIHTVNGYIGGDYGFCSSHAANTVAIALFTSLVIRRWGYNLTIASWVLLSCWSRIYLGVHYLGDILFGLFVGSLFALLIFFIWRKTPWSKHLGKISSLYTIILIVSYFITVLFLLAYSFLAV